MSEETIVCYWEGTSEGGSGGGYNDNVFDNDWDVISDPSNLYCCSWTIYFWGGSGGGSGGGGWVTDPLITKVSPVKKAPVKTFQNGQLTTRDPKWVCGPYIVIRCFNGQWWEKVTEIPCNSCDIDLELEIAESAFCSDKGAEWAEKTGIQPNTNLFRQAVAASRICCQMDDFSEACANAHYLGFQLGLTPEEVNCLSQSEETGKLVAEILNSGSVLDVCNPTNTSKDILRNAISESCHSGGDISLSEILNSLSATNDYLDFLTDYEIPLENLANIGLDFEECCGDDFSECLDAQTGRRLCIEASHLTTVGNAYYVNLGNMTINMAHQPSGVLLTWTYQNLCIQVPKGGVSKAIAAAKIATAWETGINTTEGGLNNETLPPSTAVLKDTYKNILGIGLASMFGMGCSVSTSCPGVPTVYLSWNC